MPIETPRSSEEAKRLLDRAHKAARNWWHDEEFNCYWALRDFFNQQGDQKKAQEMRWEIELLDPSYPDPGAESHDYFKRRFPEAENDYIKARYGLYLWNHLKEYQFAKESKEALRRIIDSNLTDRWFDDFEKPEWVRRALENAIQLSAELNDREWAHELLQEMNNHIEALKDGDDRHRTWDLMKRGLVAPEFLSQVDRTVLWNWAMIATSISEQMEKNNNWSVSERFMDLASNLFRATSDTENRTKAIERLARLFQQEGKEREEKEDHLAALHFYDNALKIYRERVGFPEDSDIVKELKSKIEKCSRNIRFLEIKAEAEIEEEPLIRQAERLGDLPEDQIIWSLALDPAFRPTLMDAEELEKSGKEFVASQLLSEMVLEDAGPVATFVTQEDKRAFNARKQFLLDLQVRNAIFEIILRHLFEKVYLSPEGVGSFLLSQRILPSDRVDMIIEGVRHYVNSDYVSSMHVLVPQLEQYVRFLLKRKGATTTVYYEEAVVEGSLRRLLDLPESLELFGEDFKTYLEVVLYRKEHLNLRNLVSHGLLKKEEFNALHACMLIYILFRLGTCII